MNEVEATSGLTTEYGHALQNMTSMSDAELAQSPEIQQISRQLASWTDTIAARASQQGTIFDRMAFIPPNNPYDEMRAARIAVETDDIVSGVAEITEAYAWQGAKFESTEPDESDVFNQWGEEVDIDSFLRKFWREEYSDSQCVVAMQWGWKEYTVRGKTVDSLDPNAEGVEMTQMTDPTSGQPLFDGQGNPAMQPAQPKKQTRSRRKTYKLWMPTKFIILDNLKVVPVNPSPIADDTLAWSATPAEIGWWQDIQNGTTVDVVAQEFYTGVFKPSPAERARLARLHVPNPDQLLLLNPENVWRHTPTKPDYHPYAAVRLKSIFPYLDMKRQLMAADRAALIGAANYIIVIKKGDKDMPGTPEEIDNLKANYNFIAKIPVVISDHRLSIEIVAPKTDFTLNAERYNTIDIHLLMRLLGTLSPGARGQRNETNITLSHSVARMMENRRKMIKNAFQREVIKAIVEHPKNQAAGRKLIKQIPNLVFTPRSIQLGFDPALLQALLALRTQREISRETILEQFELDESTEAMRIEYEMAVYDPIFRTQIPFAAQGVGNGGVNYGSPAANGQQGGRPSGSSSDPNDGLTD